MYAEYHSDWEGYEKWNGIYEVITWDLRGDGISTLVVGDPNKGSGTYKLLQENMTLILEFGLL